MEKTVHIEGLGDVIFRRSNRALHYRWCVKNGVLYAVIPVGGSEKQMLELTRHELVKLRKMLVNTRKQEKTVLDENTDMQTLTFRLQIRRYAMSSFRMTLKDGLLTMFCPAETDFNDERIQQHLQRMLKAALRHEAKRVLPQRVALKAREHGFTFAAVKVRDTSSRWGSCSRRKNINLSLSLLRLPAHLVDYVILHELCHTVEMNHGKRFWLLMDRVTGGRAMALRRELRRFEPL